MSPKRLTIRLSDSEWEALEAAAGTRPVSTFARETLLGNAARRRKASRRPGADQVLLARILAALGSSGLPRSMRDIAQSARTGTLPDSADLSRDIRAACLAIEKMRIDLIEALGIKAE